MSRWFLAVQAAAQAAASLAVLLVGCGGSAPRSATPAAEIEELRGPTLLEQRSSSSTVSLRIAFRTGSADDPQGKEGATEVLARLMTEGGTESLTYAELTERLFPMAAELGVSVDREQTVFTARVHRDHVEAFLPLFLNVIVRPRLAEADFQRIRAQVASELTLELRGNDDEELGKATLEAMLYEGHPYGHATLGNESGLAALTLEDVRAQRDRFLCAPRATIGLAGGYAEDFAPLVFEAIVAFRPATCEFRRTRVLAAAAQPAPRVWLVQKDDASAVAISMGVPLDVTRADPDFPALALAVTWLGQHRQFVGRLMRKMRGDRGLNYGDYAYAEHFVQDGSGVYPSPNVARDRQYFSVWIRPVSPENAQFAIRMAVRELKGFVERGLTQEELDGIRQFAAGYYALFLQTESRRLGFALDDAFYGQSQAHLARLRAAWDALTVDELNAVLRRRLDPSRLQIAVVAPNAEALATALASDAPSPIEYTSAVPEEVLTEDREIIAYPIGIARERMTVIPVAEMFR